MKSFYMHILICLISFNILTVSIVKCAVEKEMKDEFVKLKQLFSYNVDKIKSNMLKQKTSLNSKILLKLPQEDQRNLKEFDKNNISIPIEEYLRSYKKYMSLKKTTKNNKKTQKNMIKVENISPKKVEIITSKTHSMKARKLKKKFKKNIILPKNKKLKLKFHPLKKRKRGSLSRKEKSMIHQIYNIKRRILSVKDRKLPPKAVQKGNRFWGGATYVKLGQEHAPVFINESPSYLYSSPKFMRNQNGLPMPLPDSVAFSPEKIPVSSTFSFRQDDEPNYPINEDQYNHHGTPDEAIDVKKAWTFPDKGYMPMANSYPVSDRNLIQIDANPAQSYTNTNNSSSVTLREQNAGSNERNLGLFTPSLASAFASPYQKKPYVKDNLSLRMRDSYPIDEELQTEGEDKFAGMVGTKVKLLNLTRSVEDAGEKIQDLKELFDKYDGQIENIMSSIYDLNIKY